MDFVMFNVKGILMLGLMGTVGSLPALLALLRYGYRVLVEKRHIRYAVSWLMFLAVVTLVVTFWVLLLEGSVLFLAIVEKS